VALGLKVDVNKVMKSITQLVQEVTKNDPKIKAILFECTELPPYSNQVRKITGLPVFDSLTTVESFCISKKSNNRIVPPIEESTEELYYEGETSSITIMTEQNPTQ
jgi:hypothetical protein